MDTQKSGLGPVFEIRQDPKIFGLKEPDPKSLTPDPDPPLFHTKLKNMFKKMY